MKMRGFQSLLGALLFKYSWLIIMVAITPKMLGLP